VRACRLLHRQGLSVPSVDSVVDKDVRSGCRREAMTIELSNPFCNRRQPGVSIGCQEECAAILFKGVNARRCVHLLWWSSGGVGTIWRGQRGAACCWSLLGESPAAARRCMGGVIG
jgi:hypothetical protein